MPNLFENLGSLYAKNLAVVSDNNETLSYSGLEKISDQFKNKLPKRSLVFSLNTNSMGSFCGYFSFIKNEVVPLMLEATIDRELLDNLISTYKPMYLWIPEEYISMYSGNEVVYSIYDYLLLKLENQNYYQLNENLALLLTTSGSTGSPKLVRLTYGNLLANATSIAEYLSIGESERPITALPMHYSFGLSIINSHLISGSSLLLTNRSLVEKEFWAFLNSAEATSLSGIPYSFEILKKLRIFKMDLPYLRTVTQAGGKLNDELNLEFSKFFRKTGINFFVMYGQTEATARMSYLPPECSVEKIGSMGVPIPNGEFYLIDDEGGLILDSDTVGELVYKGKNVSMGYAICGEDLALGDENNGVLITGDLAKRDSDGFYYIVGRKKRFVKLFGNRVNLDETERLIKNITHDVACTGVDDKMVIYISDSNLSGAVKTFISKKTGINGRAFEIRIIDKIPKNSSGKTIYSQLHI